MGLANILIVTLFWPWLTYATEGVRPGVVQQVDNSAMSFGFASGRANITRHLDGHYIEISVKTSDAKIMPYREGFRWGGEEAEAPATLVTLIVVQRDAKKLFVPLSAYSDLGNPRRVYLKGSVSGFEVRIAGGDAGTAYNASLVSDNEFLVRRRVTHGEFPGEAWEETHYAYNTLNN